MDYADLRSSLDDQTARHAFSGVALAWRNGKTAFSYAGGLANRGRGVRNTDSTRFGVASITKMVTATTVLRLVDRGLLSLRRGRSTRLSRAGCSPPLLAAMTRPQGPVSSDLEHYGYGCRLVVEDGSVTILGHGGGDPGVSARVAHHRAAGTTIVVLCNQDRGSWAATRQISQAFGLHDPREIPIS